MNSTPSQPQPSPIGKADKTAHARRLAAQAFAQSAQAAAAVACYRRELELSAKVENQLREELADMAIDLADARRALCRAQWWQGLAWILLAIVAFLVIASVSSSCVPARASATSQPGPIIRPLSPSDLEPAGLPADLSDWGILVIDADGRKDGR